MEIGKHSDLGALARGSANYSGNHRENSGMPKGMGLIPLGNRDRDITAYGIDVVEERGSDPNIRRI